MNRSRTIVALLTVGLVAGGSTFVVAGGIVTSLLDGSRSQCDHTTSSVQAATMAFFPSGGIVVRGPLGRPAHPDLGSHSARCVS